MLKHPKKISQEKFLLRPIMLREGTDREQGERLLKKQRNGATWRQWLC